MAALNFPSPAGDGDIYQGTNGVTYIYISDGLGGGYWSGASGASNEAPNIDIGNDPPPFPKEGDLWWDSTVTSGRLYVYYKDGDSEQWVETSPMGGEDPQDDLWKKLGSELSPSDSTDNVVIGGGNITLNADGSADFNGSVSVYDGNGDINHRLIYNEKAYFGYNTVQLNRVPSSTGSIQGSINVFAGGTSNTNPCFAAYDNGGNRFTIEGDGTTKIGGTLPSAPNVLLNADGSITAAGGSFEVANNGRVDIYRRTGTGTNTALEVFSDVNSVKDSKFKLYADGSATFKGRVSAGDITGNYGMTVIAGGEITSNYGVFVATHEKSGGSLFVGQNGAGQVNARIKEDGSASFAGSSVVGQFNKLSNTTRGIYLGLGSDNAVVAVQSATTQSGAANAFEVWNGTDLRWWVTSLGGLNTRSSVKASNIILNLEADDDTKYTTTTEADGNETRVYNGETLDVKALLLTLRTAASRIETLETAKASLEARLTALEGAN